MKGEGGGKTAGKTAGETEGQNGRGRWRGLGREQSTNNRYGKPKQRGNYGGTEGAVNGAGHEPNKCSDRDPPAVIGLGQRCEGNWPHRKAHQEKATWSGPRWSSLLLDNPEGGDEGKVAFAATSIAVTAMNHLFHSCHSAPLRRGGGGWGG